GFRLRAAARGDASPESVLMGQAFVELDRGHPRAAAGYLGELLERNPRNARARQLYDLIQSAYIRAAGGMNDFPTFVLFNPSRLLTWLSRTIGGFLFSWRGMVPILLFIALGAYAYTAISFDHVTFGVLDIALAVFFFQLQALFHEL